MPILNRLEEGNLTNLEQTAMLEFKSLCDINRIFEIYIKLRLGHLYNDYDRKNNETQRLSLFRVKQVCEW